MEPPSTAREPTLVIVSERGTDLRVPLRTPVVIGRDPANEVTIDDNYLSRRHCQFAARNRRVVVRDLGSYNGTFINGQKIHEECYVLPGDVLRVGRCRVVIDFGDVASQESALKIYSPDLAPGRGVKPISRAKAPQLTEGYRRLSRELPLPPDAAVGILESTSHGPKTHTQHRRVSPDDKTPIPVPDVEDSAIARASGSRTGDQQRDGMRMIAQLTRVLSNLEDVHEFFDYALSRILAVIPAERGIIMRLGSGGRGLFPECARSAVPGRDHAQALRLGISHTVARKVIRERVSVLVDDAAVDQRFKQASSIQDLQIRSVLCAPLWLGERVSGLIYLDHMLHAYAFSEPDRDLLVAAANLAALGLERLDRR